MAGNVNITAAAMDLDTNGAKAARITGPVAVAGTDRVGAANKEMMTTARAGGDEVQWAAA